MWIVRNQGPSWAEVRRGPQDGDSWSCPLHDEEELQGEGRVQAGLSREGAAEHRAEKDPHQELPSCEGQHGHLQAFRPPGQGCGGKEDSECLQAAKRRAAKCVALGGPWAHWNWMSERLEFLHLEKQHNEIMQDSWQQYIEEGGEIARPAPQSSPGPDQLPEQLAEQEALCCAYVCQYWCVLCS